MSIQTKYHILEQAYPDMLAGIGMLIQKGKLSRRFTSLQLDEVEIQELIKAKELCELRIIELWEYRNEEESANEFKALFEALYAAVVGKATREARDEIMTILPLC